jgi:hypothetical protein
LRQEKAEKSLVSQIPFSLAMSYIHKGRMRIRQQEDRGTIVFTIAIVMMGDSCHGRVSQAVGYGTITHYEQREAA